MHLSQIIHPGPLFHTTILWVQTWPQIIKCKKKTKNPKQKHASQLAKRFSCEAKISHQSLYVSTLFSEAESTQ